MESHHGSADAHGSLRLVDTGGETVWEPDPAVDTDELDALAELFIGEDEMADDEPVGGTEPVRRGPAARARNEPAVEAVITGHLPVRGAVWVRAYASAVSRGEGRPIALVRVTGDRTTVELVGSSVETDAVSDTELAIQAVSSATEHWLLHFDEIDQAGMLRERGFDRVTVLSGADEPAVVSAYRLLKTLSDDRGDAIAEGALDVGISIVGSGHDETARATDRIGIAAKRFLSMDLSARRAVPKIETATVSMIGDVDRRCEPSGLLETIAACVADAREPAVDRETARRVASVLDSGRPGPAVETSAAASVLGDEHVRTGRVADGSAAGVVRPAARRAFDRADSPAETALTSDRPLPSTLVAGLTGLDLPCPVADGVEIATDGEGGLHLLAWWDGDAAGRLMKARVWAGINLPLLARLAPLDASKRRATLHAVCDSVGVAADLRGAEMTVHLAQPITAATANGWVTTAVE
jgi:hypothetical protein